MTPEAPSPASQLVTACRRLLAAQSEADAAALAREAAVRAVTEAEGLPKTRAGERIRALLAAEGFTPAEVAALGLSDASVRLYIERPRQG